LQGFNLIVKRQVMNREVVGLSLIGAIRGEKYKLFCKCSLSSKTFLILDGGLHPKILLLEKLIHIP